MATVAPPLDASAQQIRPIADPQQRLAQALLLVACAALVLFLLAPLASILVKSVQERTAHSSASRNFASTCSRLRCWNRRGIPSGSQAW